MDDDDIEVTVQVLTRCRNTWRDPRWYSVVEEDNENECTAKDEVLVKSSNEEMQQATETLLTYSLFTENWEIGAMGTKISLLFNQSSLGSQSKWP